MMPYEPEDLAAYRERFAGLNRFVEEPQPSSNVAEAPRPKRGRPKQPATENPVRRQQKKYPRVRLGDKATCNHQLDGATCWIKTGMHKGKQRYECGACGKKTVLASPALLPGRAIESRSC
jgi:hypothetical protein